jgi:iron complex transport system substrate-binding protein
MRTLTRALGLVAMLAAASVARAQAAATLVDGRGVAVPLEPTPQRIASATVGTDEMLVEILARAGHTQRLVALSALADDPRSSDLGAAAKTVAGRLGSELEHALALKPDLVLLASYNDADFMARLGRAHVRTFVLSSFSTLDDVEANLERLGRLTHEEKAAAAVLAAFRAERARLAAHGRARRAAPRLLALGADGSVSAAGTLFDEIARLVGARNVAAEAGLKGWPRPDPEALAMLAPTDVVVEGEPEERAARIATLSAQAATRALAAVRAGRVIVVPAREMSSVSQHLLKAAERLSRALDQAADDASAKAPAPEKANPMAPEKASPMVPEKASPTAPSSPAAKP